MFVRNVVRSEKRSLYEKFYCFYLKQHPFHRTHSQFLRVPGHRRATTWVHYTTCCKTQPCSPEDGQKIVRNKLS